MHEQNGTIDDLLNEMSQDGCFLSVERNRRPRSVFAERMVEDRDWIVSVFTWEAGGSKHRT
jgi:hypothetical protein